ncbi:MULTISPECIES: signal recognition particle protein [Acidobacterium]|uniref:Signal recognition particle protein n=1 Tax=Acidobacterium capsulatum (strain ATCC 51196 / DSM 11244 / BCRC 80197 / JCM 7670 / NBRC 15755 / NCIMB 13165 / 161) TaxID=240015 RepID=C1F573_ACIC5|nr:MULTISPECIES: signal recognition particle protein [Acidobacterium]ACO32779.1 signal recognition particle protein [Acidobacterium capsulatum ATCC 51196]HCT61187.1 signal recognition particle protein [Acidobacterium sp.]
MFDNLSEKLQRAFKNLRGQGTVTEENIQEALREIRVALLEADVNLNVAKELIEHIRERAVGQQVMTALSPTEQVIKIVRDELVDLLGKDTARFQFASRPPTVILMAGLQGSGKTTTSGKLAAWLKKGGHRPMLVSVDVYRPAAREQLKVVANSINAKIYEGDTKGEAAGTALVERLAKEARREAVITGCDTLIVDTAGRLHIDDNLMDEMTRLKALLAPQEILFVADAMTGQDAVRSAQEFHRKLALTGVVLTKMDGDARGGAALSIRHVTGQPVKFIGTGEKPDAFEPFHPDRIVSRILGMGDIMSLIEKAEETLDKKKSEEFARKALSGDGFSLEDFRDQLRQIRKMGSLQNIMKMLPSVGPFAGMQQMAGQVDEKQFVRVEAIINSMTPYERNHHEVISGARRKRIANGSGTSVQEVNQLLRQYAQMRKMFKGLGKGNVLQRRAMGMMSGMKGLGR